MSDLESSFVDSDSSYTSRKPRKATKTKKNMKRMAGKR